MNEWMNGWVAESEDAVVVVLKVFILAISDVTGTDGTLWSTCWAIAIDQSVEHLTLGLQEYGNRTGCSACRVNHNAELYSDSLLSIL